MFKFSQEVIRQAGSDKIAATSATISYYTIFALAPTLFIFVALSSLIIGSSNAVLWLQTLLQRYIGENGNLFLNNTLSSSFQDGDVHSLVALAGILLIIYGVSSAFFSINQAFADIFNFNIIEEADRPLVKVVKTRLHSFIYLIGLFFIIIAFTVINILLKIVSNLIIGFLPSTINDLGVGILGYFFSTIVVGLLFGLIYRYASRGQISWRGGLVGGAVASVLFNLVNLFFSIYISYSSVIPLYGVSSFLVVFLIWIYYSVEVSLLGAVVAKIYECRYPHHRRRVCL